MCGVEHALYREPRLVGTPARIAQAAAKGDIFEDTGKGGAKGRLVSAGDKQAALFVVDGLPDPAHIGRDDGQARAHGLQDRERKALLAGNEDESVRGREQGGDVLADAQKFDLGAEVACCGLDLGSIRTVADETEGERRSYASEGREEEPVIRAFNRVRTTGTNAMLIVAARHPERFDEVERLCRQEGLTTVRRSELPIDAEPRADAVVLDTIGELAQLYQIATVVFVGGSLVPAGGHNILEPALYGKPIVFGPSMQNFGEIAETFLANGAAEPSEP